jgi:hypothetical protein
MHWISAVVLAIAAGAVDASYHTFQIEQIFSNADGTIQFVVLRVAGDGWGEHAGGHT